jgi:hypothetical protein
MDELENNLMQMKKTHLPCELKQRLRANFRKRYERHKRLQQIGGLASCVSGVILLIPTVQTLWVSPETLNLRWSAIRNSLEWLFNGQAQWQSVQHLPGLTGELLATFALTTWVGLGMLAAGSGISLNAWLPGTMRKA